VPPILYHYINLMHRVSASVQNAIIRRNWSTK
jgi:hypothetical protein